MAVKTAWRLLSRTVKDWNRDNASMHAAALSYYTAFSIAPLLVIGVAIAGLAFGEQAARGEIAVHLEKIVGHGGARAIETMKAHSRKQESGILANVFGFVVLVLGASGVFQQLRQSLNIVWKVEAAKTRGAASFVRSRLLSFGMVLAIGFIMLVSLLASAIIAGLGSRIEAHWPGAEALLHVLTSLVTFAVIAVLFALIYKVLPDADVQWRDVWLGGAITALLFTLGKLALALYLGKSSVTSSYGAAASLGIVLIWVYYSSELLLFGAEFTHVFAE